MQFVRVLATAVGVAMAWGAAAQDAPSAAPVAAASSSQAAEAPQPADLAQIGQRFQERFPGVTPTQVSPTPFAGLYEVRIGRDLLYTDAQVSYLMQGALIDAGTRTDLTAQRLDALNKVAFADLPLDKSIKQVRGTGKRQIAIFEDPNCGYCKQFHRTLEQVDDITVHTLLFPILSEDSTEKARNLWCAKDPVEAWRAWMLRGTVPATAQCDTPIEELLALGRSLMVQGTPAVIFADGSRVNGAMPLQALLKKLDQVSGGQ